MKRDGADSGEFDGPDAFAQALAHLGPRLLAALAALEHARRRLHPPRLGAIGEELAPLRAALAEAWTNFESTSPQAGLTGLADELRRATQHALEALAALSGTGPGDRAATHTAASAGAPVAPEAAMRVLDAMHRHHRAEAALFPLRRVLPPVNPFFLEAPCRGRLAELDPEQPPCPEHAGFHRAAGDASGRGGFLLYVPESYGGTPWPLVVALHGGSGNGDDFLWMWLREARSRRFILLAPTSRGSTWSLNAPAIDTLALHAMVEAVCERIAVDRERTLLTGLSDGASFSLIAGLQQGSPFRALAPVSGVLHPMLLADPAVRERLRGRRIHLVHGALDWMFPVSLARETAERLQELGADLVYREIDDLSHTYPREENDRILGWFDSALRLQA